MDFTPSPSIRLEKIHVSSIRGFLEDLRINQSILAAILFSELANITSMTNMPSTSETKNSFREFCWLQLLCTVKIMKLLESIFALKRLNNFNSLLAIQNSSLGCLNNCLPHGKLSFLSVIFTFQMQTT